MENYHIQIRVMLFVPKLTLALSRRPSEFFLLAVVLNICRRKLETFAGINWRHLIAQIGDILNHSRLDRSITVYTILFSLYCFIPAHAPLAFRTDCKLVTVINGEKNVVNK